MEDIWYYVFGVGIGLILLSVMIILVRRIVKKNKNAVRQNELLEKFITLIGGKENVIESEAKSSRLVLVLKDYNLLNEEELKSLGVSSIIKMTNKVTLVVGNFALEIASYLNK